MCLFICGMQFSACKLAVGSKLFWKHKLFAKCSHKTYSYHILMKKNPFHSISPSIPHPHKPSHKIRTTTTKIAEQVYTCKCLQVHEFQTSIQVHFNLSSVCKLAVKSELCTWFASTNSNTPWHADKDRDTS